MTAIVCYAHIMSYQLTNSPPPHTRRNCYYFYSSGTKKDYYQMSMGFNFDGTMHGRGEDALGLFELEGVGDKVFGDCSFAFSKTYVNRGLTSRGECNCSIGHRHCHCHHYYHLIIAAFLNLILSIVSLFVCQADTFATLAFGAGVAYLVI